MGIGSQYMDAMERAYKRKQAAIAAGDQPVPSFGERVGDFLTAPLVALSTIYQPIESQYIDAVTRRQRTYRPHEAIASLQRYIENPNGLRTEQVLGNETNELDDQANGLDSEANELDNKANELDNEANELDNEAKE